MSRFPWQGGVGGVAASPWPRRSRLSPIALPGASDVYLASCQSVRFDATDTAAVMVEGGWGCGGGEWLGGLGTSASQPTAVGGKRKQHGSNPPCVTLDRNLGTGSEEVDGW